MKGSFERENGRTFEIAVFTSTRADFGIYAPLLYALQEYKDIRLSLLVTGTHLSESQGMTVREIEAEGFPIAARIPILAAGEDTPETTSKTMANAMLGFSSYFAAQRPDCLFLLGDRYETAAVAFAALNEQIPMVHLHGGERTDGATDDVFRHCITKCAALHFTSTEEYRRRVIQLGEHPDRVFAVGALGVENMKKVVPLTREALSESLGFALDAPFALGTYHPVTTDVGGAALECAELIAAIEAFPHLKFLITQANADVGGRVINEMLRALAAAHPDRICFVPSLGRVRYFSALRYAEFVFGNSSSALIEVPSFGIPTVNIGIRQQGRAAGESVIHCNPTRADIVAAMQRAESAAFRETARTAANPYEGENTSRCIAETVHAFLVSGELFRLKKFYDLQGEFLK